MNLIQKKYLVIAALCLYTNVFTAADDPNLPHQHELYFQLMHSNPELPFLLETSNYDPNFFYPGTSDTLLTQALDAPSWIPYTATPAYTAQIVRILLSHPSINPNLPMISQYTEVLPLELIAKHPNPDAAYYLLNHPAIDFSFPRVSALSKLFAHWNEQTDADAALKTGALLIYHHGFLLADALNAESLGHADALQTMLDLINERKKKASLKEWCVRLIKQKKIPLPIELNPENRDSALGSALTAGGYYSEIDPFSPHTPSTR